MAPWPLGRFGLSFSWFAYFVLGAALAYGGPMLSLLRIFQRSGGLLTTAAALLGFAFYGIALLSVDLVEDPSRALQILAIFLLLSLVFILLLVWAVRRAVARVRRPLETAVAATSRLASMSGRGGRGAVQFLGRKSAAAGEWVTHTGRSVRRRASRASGFLFRRRRRDPGAPATPPAAGVFPIYILGGSGSRGME